MLLDWLDPFLGINKYPARPIGNPNNTLVPVKIHLDLIDSMGTGEKSDLEGKEVIQKIWDRQSYTQTKSGMELLRNQKSFFCFDPNPIVIN